MRLRNGLQHCAFGLLIAASAMLGWWYSAAVRPKPHRRTSAPVESRFQKRGVLPGLNQQVPWRDEITNEQRQRDSKSRQDPIDIRRAIPGVIPFPASALY